MIIGCSVYLRELLLVNSRSSFSAHAADFDVTLLHSLRQRTRRTSVRPRDALGRLERRSPRPSASLGLRPLPPTLHPLPIDLSAPATTTVLFLPDGQIAAKCVPYTAVEATPTVRTQTPTPGHDLEGVGRVKRNDAITVTMQVSGLSQQLVAWRGGGSKPGAARSLGGWARRSGTFAWSRCSRRCQEAAEALKVPRHGWRSAGISRRLARPVRRRPTDASRAARQPLNHPAFHVVGPADSTLWHLNSHPLTMKLMEDN